MHNGRVALTLTALPQGICCADCGATEDNQIKVHLAQTVRFTLSECHISIDMLGRLMQTECSAT